MLANLFADFDTDRQQKVRLAAARFLDSAEDVLLRFRAEAWQRRDAAGARRFFQLVEIADAELLVQDADLFQSELRHAQQLENAGRILRPQLFQILRLPAADQLFDDGGSR